MHHYKKTVENFEDEEKKDKGLVWWQTLLIIFGVILITIAVIKLYYFLKKEDNSYAKLRNPKSREDCFELKSGKRTLNKDCLYTWQRENMTPAQIAIAMGEVRDIVQ